MTNDTATTSHAIERCTRWSSRRMAQRRIAWLGGIALLLGQGGGENLARAQHEATDPAVLWLVADRDDDDDDGVIDNVQGEHVPPQDLRPLHALVRPGDRLRITGGHVRVVEAGRPSTGTTQVESPGMLYLQGLSAGRSFLVVERQGRLLRFPLVVAALRILDGHNQSVEATDQLGVALRITSDGSLPRNFTFDGQSDEARDIRVELVAPTTGGQRDEATLTTGWGGRAGQDTQQLSVALQRATPQGPYRSAFVRLVGDFVDADAPGARTRVLPVGLGQKLAVRWIAPDGSQLGQHVRIGQKLGLPASIYALRARLSVRVLRTHAGGLPVVGLTDASALAIAYNQIATADRIWSQCGITFGLPEHIDVALAAPPPPALLAIADNNGLPARGNGTIQFSAGGISIGPLPTAAGASAVDTAMNIAGALESAGLTAIVTRNPPTTFGAGPSADILIRDQEGGLVPLSQLGDIPLSTDSQQRVAIGDVDLSDGLMDFNNMNAQAGTLEERTLIKALGDGDPATIDVFFVNHFSSGTRQGEAFIERGGAILGNAVIIDRNGLRQQDNAWTLAHELGHVLLNQPLHPDNVGHDRPWLLMDADSARGSVYGPKRLTPHECARVLYESGPDSQPPLLAPLYWAPQADQPPLETETVPAPVASGVKQH